MYLTVRITSELIVIARHKVWKKQVLDTKTLVVRGGLERLMQADTQSHIPHIYVCKAVFPLHQLVIPIKKKRCPAEYRTSKKLLVSSKDPTRTIFLNRRNQRMRSLCL